MKKTSLLRAIGVGLLLLNAQEIIAKTDKY
jgi:ABC-type amino acid transport system permease subunit